MTFFFRAFLAAMIIYIIQSLVANEQGKAFLLETSASSITHLDFFFYILSAFLIITLLLFYISYSKDLRLRKEIIYLKKMEKEAAVNAANLQNAVSLYKATLDATADGILVVDQNRKIAGYNEVFRAMWKIPESVLKPGNDKEAMKCILGQVKDPEKLVEDLDKFFNREADSSSISQVEFKDGRIFERYAMPQRLGKKIIGCVFSFREVTRRKQMEEQLRHQATHDALTSLPNRTLLLDRINQAIKYAKRNQQALALLFFDLDHFKLINDSFGHDMGDILLQSAAKRLQGCIRETDTVARWGGDEFVILLTSLKSDKDVIPTIKKCLTTLKELFTINKQSLSITCSVGVSFFPRDGEDARTLLKNADTAMYYAKDDGRNSFKLYASSMNARTEEMLNLETDLRQAIEHNQLTLHYQPLVDIQTSVVLGAEALIRWFHPKRGLISPAEFIPLAEETGLIGFIGEWVIRTACQQNKAWQEQGLPPIFMAVNLSGQQFRQKNIADLVKEILEETQLAPQYLELELTESAMIASTHAFLNILNAIKQVGVTLVIDDFGTGYSSLSYLKRFPVDALKIDQSFVRDIARDENDEAIVRAIVAIAHQLNLKVIAEGIETLDQLAFLREHQCAIGQGYLFSKPVDSAAFANLLKKKTLIPARLEEPKISRVPKKNQKAPLRNSQPSV